MQGKLDDAIAEFAKAVEIDPEYGAAEGNLGRALVESGKLDDGVAHLQKALALAPESAEVETELGLGLAEKGQVDVAIPHFQHAIVLAPKSADAHAYLGTALVMKGQRADALEQWRDALKVDPDNVRVLNDAAWLMSTSSEASLRNGTEAVRLAGHAADLTKGQEPMVLGTLAASLAESGDFDKAVNAEQHAVDLARQHGNDRLAQLLEQRLALFQAKTPIREH